MGKRGWKTLDVTRGAVSVTSPVLSHGRHLTSRLHRQFGRTNACIVGILSDPNSNGAAAVLNAGRHLHSGTNLHYTIVRNSVTSSISTVAVGRTNVPTVRVGANNLYRLRNGVVVRTISTFSRTINLRGVSIVFVRGINGLIYPISFSLNRGLSVVVLSIPRNSSGPVGCPNVFRRTNTRLLGGISITPTFSFSVSECAGALSSLGPRTPQFTIDTHGNRNVST